MLCAQSIVGFDRFMKVQHFYWGMYKGTKPTMLHNFKSQVHALEQRMDSRCIPLRRMVNVCVRNALAGGANVSVAELIEELRMLGFGEDAPLVNKLEEIDRLSALMGVSVALPSAMDWKEDRFNATAGIDEVLINLEQAYEKQVAEDIAQDWIQRGRAQRVAREAAGGKRDDLDPVAKDWIVRAENKRLMRKMQNLRRLQLQRHAVADTSSGTESEPEPELV